MNGLSSVSEPTRKRFNVAGVDGLSSQGERPSVGMIKTGEAANSVFDLVMLDLAWMPDLGGLKDAREPFVQLQGRVWDTVERAYPFRQEFVDIGRCFGCDAVPEMIGVGFPAG